MTRLPHDIASARLAPIFGVALVLLALPGLRASPAVFWAAWLASCWFDLGLILGALTWLWIHRLSGGGWGIALRPHVLGLAARLPRALLFCAPLLFGLRLLYPWLGQAARAAGSPVADPAFLEAWHAPAFLAARLVVYAAVWLALARAARRPLSGGGAASALMLHLVVTSLASVDLLAALVPGWSSSVFGLLAISGQAFGGGAAAIALACSAQRRGASQPVSDGVPLSRDYGNLLLTAVLFWAYLSFMQLLIIWAENLPREISWYVPRLQTGWLLVGVGLVAFHFALPLFLLLFRSIKDSPARLEYLALAMVAAHALDVAWLVLPSVAPHELAAWWLTPTLMLGLALLTFGGPPLRIAAGRKARATETAGVQA
jgi:hypothetical protein